MHFSCSTYWLHDTIVGRLRNEPPEGSCIHTLSFIVRKQTGLSCSLQSRNEKCNWDPTYAHLYTLATFLPQQFFLSRSAVYKITFLFYLGTSHLSILEAAVNLLTPKIWLLILPSNFPHFLVNQLCESSVRSRQQLLPDKLEFSRFHVNHF